MATGLLRRLREAVSASAEPQLQRGGDDTEIEESVSAASRKSAEENDDTMAGGKYPIRDQAEADKAWKLRNNGTADEASVVAHIRKQVKKHGLTMPSASTRESAAPDAIALGRILLREAKVTKTGGTYEATVVREGPGNPSDSNYYTKQALQAAVKGGLFEGLQAYANHPTASEERDRPERDVRQLVGHFREARFIDGNPAEVRAKFVPVNGPGYEWVRSLIESALGSVPGRPLIGISIDGYGHAPDQKNVNGRTYNMVREVTHLGSADIVTRAGAGGQFHRHLQEAWRDTGTADRRPETSKEAHMKPAQLQEKVKAALGKLTEAAGLKDEDEKAGTLIDEGMTVLRECADVTLEVPAPEVKIQEKIVEKIVAAGDGKADELAAELATTQTKLQETVRERDEHKTARTEAENKLAANDAAKLASKVLREAKVPEKSAIAWFDDVVAVGDEGSMKSLVQRRMDERESIFAEFRESYGVEGAGPRLPEAPAPAATGGLLGAMGIDRDELAA